MINTHATPLKLATGQTGAPKVSGDGRTVVWNQMVDGNLEIMRWHDGQLDQLTRNDRADMHPVVNGDGSSIAWTRFSSADPNDPAGHWDVVLLKDGQETYVTDSPANEMDPCLSADGKSIAWNTDGDGKMGVWGIAEQRDGEAARLITDLNDHVGQVYSADGSRLFWTNNQGGGFSQISMRDQDGTVKDLTFGLGKRNSPAPNQDGSEVVYTRVSWQGDDDLVRQRTGGLTEIVSAKKRVDETWACQSADGGTIAWTNFDRRGENVDTQILARTEGRIEAMTEGPGMHSFPSASDDGKTLAWMWIDENDTNERAVYLLQR